MPQKANDSPDKVRHFQRTLYQTAKRNPKRRFHALYDKVCRPDVLKRAWGEVRANRGQGGVDQQTIEEIEEKIGVEAFLKQIHEELRESRYRPLPVRRVEIPKAQGGTRPLGIPVIRDRVVQAACRIVVEPIFEADFLETSFGFRPKRSAHQAHREIKQTINQGYNWVMDGDIAKYFDSIDQRKLMILLHLRISDRKVLRLIWRWLRAGVMTEGKFAPTEKGTPQGGVISPLLSNIYLHFLDREWQRAHKHQGKLIRYADDFVILCRNLPAVQQARQAIQGLLDRLGLILHPEKTRIVDLNRGKEGFNFLGFHFRKCASWKYPGKYYCLSWPSANAMKRIRQKIKAIAADWWRLMFPIESLVETLNPIIRGWVNYFRVGNSSRKFVAVDKYVYHRLTLFWRRKHRLRGRVLSAETYESLDIFQAAGQVRWA